MIYGSLFIVLIVTIIFYLRDKAAYKWWEFFIPFIVTFGAIIGAKAIIEHAAVTFTEYWGETITDIYEEEPWNEWITKTCTESYACGTDSKGNTEYCTRTYDCSYQDDHYPKWYCKTNLGNTHTMDESYHDSLVSLYASGKKVIKTRRNYSPRTRSCGSSGTKFNGTNVGQTSNVYKTTWPNTENTRKGVFSKHKYENRIKASDLSVFNIAIVSEEEADSMGLYKYPEKTHTFKSNTILGDNITEETQDKFRRLNAKFGPSNKMRLWILVFEDKPSITAQYQENYWVKGNKNELVVCIGKTGDEIKWSYAFSWALSGTLTTEVGSKVLDMYQYSVTTDKGQSLPVAVPMINTSMKKTIADATGIDTNLLPPVLPLNIQRQNIIKIKKSETPLFNANTLNEYYKYLDKNLYKFEKRSFEEFSYITVDPTTGNIIFIYILALIISIGINLWASNNDIHDKPTTNYSKRRY